MKHYQLLLIAFFTTNFLIAQSINPSTDVERCPTINYPNGAGFTYVITFSEHSNKFSIGTQTNCVVTNYTTSFGGDTLKASIIVQFKDQSAQEHKFEIKKAVRL
jgi:hypothetical protein